MEYKRYCPHCQTWFEAEGRQIEKCPNCEKEIHTAKCNRCGHEWPLRFASYPTICANTKCKSPYYNSPRMKPFGKIRYVEPETNKSTEEVTS